MLSVPDIAIIGAVALLVFGPEQLPVIARKFGAVMRDVQNTSQQFIREMERAADEHEPPVAERHLEAVPDYEPTLPGLEAAAVEPPPTAAEKKVPAEPSEY